MSEPEKPLPPKYLAGTGVTIRVEDKRPLHVKVAEALGWTEIGTCGDKAGTHCGKPPEIDRERIENDALEDDSYCPHDNCGVLRYDTDWSATGPLLERFKIEVDPEDPFWLARHRAAGYTDAAEWTAQQWGERYGEWVVLGDKWGETPLIAICNLIVFLHSAGKLQEKA